MATVTVDLTDLERVLQLAAVAAETARQTRDSTETGSAWTAALAHGDVTAFERLDSAASEARLAL